MWVEPADETEEADASLSDPIEPLNQSSAKGHILRKSIKA